MNKLLNKLEEFVCGKVDDPLDRPILKFPNGGPIFTVRHLMEGTLVLGNIGKGKSTLLKTYLHAMLVHGFGGLILSVKKSQIKEAQEACSRAGRKTDCITFDVQSGHVFNPLEGAGAEDLIDVTNLMMMLVNVNDPVTRAGTNDLHWIKQTDEAIKNLFALCYVVYGRYDVVLSAELFSGRAKTLSQVMDPIWQQQSVMAKALAKIPKEALADTNVRLAVDYFQKEFPDRDSRQQTSVSSSVDNIFNQMRRPPLSNLFSGESTFSMADILNGRKVLVVGMAALDSDEGRFVNSVLQFCFCKQAERIKRVNNAFLISDECQETVTPKLMKNLATMREYRIAPILLSQNLPVLEQKMDEVNRKTLCGMAGTKIFCNLGCTETAQWAREQVGKIKKTVETKTQGYSSGNNGSGQNHGTSTHEVEEYRVQAIRFAQLEVGETICVRDGKAWNAKWHKDTPGKSGTVRVL